MQGFLLIQMGLSMVNAGFSTDTDRLKYGKSMPRFILIQIGLGMVNAGFSADTDRLKYGKYRCCFF